MDEHFEILVVDDETELHRAIQRLFRATEYVIYGVRNGRETTEFLHSHQVEVVILDMRLPDADGLSLLETIKMRHPHIWVLILTGFGTVKGAVAAMHLGATDFIEKQYLREQLPAHVDQLHRLWQLDRENARLNEQLAERSETAGIIGTSTPILGLKETIGRIAATESSVLIIGETGTGKELVARELHRRSARAQAQLVPVDCAAINDSTFESEMFGHVKGAFTGAQDSHEGLIRAADGGTLFFDEIGELPQAVQAKLLRTIQERKVRPVGGTKSKSVDVRIIAATNRDLSQEVAAGRFREDLYYRLNVITLRVPPLRERNEDILLLFRYFLRRYAPDSQRQYIEPEVLDALSRYPWPGNVRELQNAAGHVQAFAQNGRIASRDLPPHLTANGMGEQQPTASSGNETPAPAGTTSPEPSGAPATDARHVRTLEEQERDAIKSALTSAGGNRSEAAEQLGIGVATLYRKLKKYGLN